MRVAHPVVVRLAYRWIGSMKMLERLREHAAAHPLRTALSGPDWQFSYGQLVSEVEQAIRQLCEVGTQVLAISMDNGPAWVILDIAALQLDICVVPLPGFFSSAQTQHTIRRAGVQGVATDDPDGLRERCGGMLQTGERTLEIGGQRVSWLKVQQDSCAPTAPLARVVHKVTFTSGTTADPKGVMLDWQQMRAVVESLVGAVGMAPDDRHLVLMPLAVLLDNIAGVYVALWAGAVVELWPLARIGLTGAAALNARLMVDALGRSRATTAIFSPQTLQGVVEQLEMHESSGLTLRFAAIGGAPVSPQLLERAARVGVPAYEGYGLSECGSVVCLNTPAQQRPGSVGRPLPHLQLSIADDGEVWVSGRGFLGYLGDADPHRAVWPTGDLGELDVDGYLFLRGRKRNVFITSSGRNVAPEWVERELVLEGAIRQAALFGEARPFNVAILVAAPDANVAQIDAAVERVNRTLPDYARVARWVRARSPFSVANGLLTGTGRIRRDALAQRYDRVIESLYSEALSS